MNGESLEQKQNLEDELFKNGSVWLRADFHLHTIKDKEFSKAEIKNENDFVKMFVQRLKEENIGIGVITNHNKFDKDEYKAIKRKAKKENIMIFAGTELSVSDGSNGIHCLIVFDESTWLRDGTDYIDQFLTAAFEGVQNRENKNTRCRYNLDALFEKLDEHRIQGRDSFVVLAHVEQKSGFFHELDGGRISQIAESELFKKTVIALQKIRSYGNLDKYTEWFGCPLPAFVEGSDCKSLSEVGKASKQRDKDKKTFIKIGDFNFEALKYALIDKDHRVKSERPACSNSYIKSIQFIGGKLDGKSIEFSSELNNLIGIRGSGKSSILEILRYTLGIELKKSSADTTYKNDLIQYILGSGGKAIVHIVNKNNEVFKIEKIYGQKESIFKINLENNSEGLCDCSISAIFDSPVYFGQKDLSNKKEDFESDLLKRLIGDKLQHTERAIAIKKDEINSIILEIQKTLNFDAQKEKTEKLIKDVEQKLLYFKEKGVEEKLQLQTQFEKDCNVLTQCRDRLNLYNDDIESIISDYESFFSQALTASAVINEEIFKDANECLNELKTNFYSLQKIKNDTNLSLQKFDAILKTLDIKRNEMSEEFAKIKREINSDTLNPDTFLELNRRLNTSKIQIEEINKQTEKRSALKTALIKALIELNDLWLEEFKILDDEKEKINQANSNLSIEIEFKGRKNNFLNKLKNTFRGTGIREASYQNIADNFKDFIEIYRESDKVSKVLGNSISAFNTRFNENLAELLTFRVDDKVNIKYKGKSLRSHSLGQRASALILFLLAQKDNDVLIIDQPEDDLDNQTIYDEVIKSIMKLKGQMQFIFATHNANLPVLGDSEKIIVCSFKDNSFIAVEDGTIDTPHIQKSVVNIMEGGKEAFNKRKNIYNIWDK